VESRQYPKILINVFFALRLNFARRVMAVISISSIRSSSKTQTADGEELRKEDRVNSR
jgi:hypothetical protein